MSIKKNHCVLINKKGSVLLFTLCIFMAFIVWFEGVVIKKLKHANTVNLIEEVNQRLDIQENILNYYRNNCLMEAIEDVDEVEEGQQDFLDMEDCDYYFEMHGKQISSTRIEKVIYTILGDGDISFKYDIINDGSYRQTIMEE